VITFNKPFTAWGAVFGAPVVPAAMIDLLMHHVEILTMKGEPHRLKDEKLSPPSTLSSEARP